MYDFIKQNIPTIALSVVFMATGFIFGCIINADNKGVYLSANYPNGNAAFKLGQSENNINEIDFNNLESIEYNIIISKLESLSANGQIGESLREMVREAEGPFAAIPVKLNLHLISDGSINGPVAKACRNTPVFKTAIVVFQAFNSSDQNVEINGLLGLNPMKEQLINCQQSTDNVYDIWVSKEHVLASWKIEAIENDIIIVNANIVVSAGII